MSGAEIRVLIVDDGESMRRALRLRLAGVTDVKVVGEAETASEAVQQVAARCPDVVLVSSTSPGNDFVEAVSIIGSQCNGLRIVVLAPYEEEARRALAAGANAHLLKEADIDLVVATIREVVGRRGNQH